jgi:hypothetical protein
VNSPRYDELECIGGPFDGDRLKIPAGAKRLPVPLRRPGGKPSFCERGTYERRLACLSEQRHPVNYS